ncbi:MAG: hypothetical protein ACT4NY_32375 [Pseudonocardiales bacterium]
MSTSQQGTVVRTSVGDAEGDSPGCAQLAAGSVHLVMADTALDEFHQGGGRCSAAQLPPWECPQGCMCDVEQMICQDCARRAAELSCP